MKSKLTKLILLCLLAFSIPAAHAGWFERKEDPNQQRLAKVEQELTVQRKTNDSWVIVAGVLGIGCVLLLVIGTALGSKVRRHHESNTQP